VQGRAAPPPMQRAAGSHTHMGQHRPEGVGDSVARFWVRNTQETGYRGWPDPMPNPIEDGIGRPAEQIGRNRRGKPAAPGKTSPPPPRPRPHAAGARASPPALRGGPAPAPRCAPPGPSAGWRALGFWPTHGRRKPHQTHRGGAPRDRGPHKRSNPVGTKYLDGVWEVRRRLVGRPRCGMMHVDDGPMVVQILPAAQPPPLTGPRTPRRPLSPLSRGRKGG